MPHHFILELVGFLSRGQHTVLCQADQKAIFCMDCVRMNKDCIFQLNFKVALFTSLNTALHIHIHANAWDDFKILSGQVCDASDRCSNNSLY